MSIAPTDRSNTATDADAPAGSAARQTAVVFVGHIAATGMGFVANLLTIRAVGPEGFGVVVVATTVMTIVWLLTGRGIDQAMVRYAARFDRDDPQSADAARSTVHQIKLLAGGGLVLFGLAITVPVSRFLFGAEVSPIPLGIGVVASLAATLWSYVGASLQAAYAFHRFAVVQVANAAIRLLLTAALVFGGVLTPTWAMIITGLGYLLAAGIGYVLAPPATRRLSARPDLRPAIFHASKWLVVSSIIHILYTRLDHLMLIRMVGPGATGLYGAAVSFIQIVDLLTFSMLTVFLPRFCAHAETAGLRRQARKALKVSGGLAVLILPAFFLADPVITWLLGDEFLQAVQLFEIIFFGAVFTLVTHPLQAVFHARGETHLLTALDAGLLVVNGVCNLVAIHLYGVTGAATVALLTRIAGGLALSVIVYVRLRTGDRPEGDHARAAPTDNHADDVA